MNAHSASLSVDCKVGEMLPSLWDQQLKAKTLTAVKVKDFQVRRELRIVYRKDKHLDRAAKAFIELQEQNLDC
jgi:DNA-binding transcriptional LysR family regulator